MSTPITLITGGSRGLGAAMAMALARDGHDLVLSYRERADAAASVVAQIEQLGQRAVALPLDLADASQYAPFVERLAATLLGWGEGRQLSGLVNNAGHGVHQAFAETEADAFDGLLAVHLRAPFFLTQALLPLLADGAHIVNISTGLTRFTSPGYAAYAAAKGALEVLTRYQAKELAARGIRVNTLAPGAIETDFGGGAVRDNAPLNAYLASVTALGRVGRADDIGAALATLMRPGSGWITGQRIEASGGMFL